MEFTIGTVTKDKREITVPVTFYIEEEAFSGVKKVADMVREDANLVTGITPDKTSDKSCLGECPILVGTVGKSSMLEELQEQGKIDLSQIKGKREVFLFQLVEQAVEGANTALVIAGSDKRGTIYGLFHLSECMGVSPLVHWSDVKPQKNDCIVLSEEDNRISKEPSVKYRGIFINDEWPAFGNWAMEHFGGLNAKMYEHVFELILRLKGNYLWPAMWKTNFNCEGPGILNAELADELGIVMGTSHHEPCMRNGEEYSQVRGKDSIYGDAWNFITNREGISRFWEDGLKRNREFENVITLGMRGEQDTKILGEKATLADNIALLKDVIKEQNQLIQKNVCEDLSEASRVFVVFTEVEDFFYGDETTPGLLGDKELDGVTVMLSDDNFGNLRCVPTEKMQNHPGGYGLYYHLDFHGGAYAYDWMNTDYLPKMWEQLCMAYDYGIQDIWVANVGDICFLEYPMTYYFELAYDMEKWGSQNPNNTSHFTSQWIERQFHNAFTKEEKDVIKEILEIYTKTNHNRKPEVMNAGVYHPVHYKEAENLIQKADRLTMLCNDLIKRCPESMVPAFYELIYFPAVASMNVHKMQLIAGRNKFFARQNRVEANDLANEIRRCIEEDRKLTEKLHTIDEGKWYGMGLSEHVGFVNWNEEGNRYPLIIQIEPANKPRIVVAKSDSSIYTEGLAWSRKTLLVDDFLRPDINEVNIDIACASKQAVEYEIICECPWITLSKQNGLVDKTDVVTVKVDKSLLKGKEKGDILIVSPKSKIYLEIWAENTDVSTLAPYTFLERNGYIAIEAEHYCSKHDVTGFGFACLEDYGRTLSGMKVLPPKHDFTDVADRPYLEYCFEAQHEGEYELELYLAPSNTAHRDHRLYFGIQMNEEEIQMENAVSERFRSLDLGCMEWIRAVTDNIRIYQTKVSCKEGINHLRIYAISPFFVLEKIVLHTKDNPLAESYLGPTESYFIQ